MSIIRIAKPEDLSSLAELDSHIDRAEIERKIDSQEIVVLEISGQVVGLLRYSKFWDEIPFMNMLRIAEKFQAQGHGRNLVHWWEKMVRTQGFSKVLTSTMANEGAQNFYRKLGYTDIGGFVLPEEPLEIILLKTFES